MKEYKTTEDEWWPADVDEYREDAFTPDPRPPKGDGWVMCGSAINGTPASGGTMFWFWVRDTRVPADV